MEEKEFIELILSDATVDLSLNLVSEIQVTMPSSPTLEVRLESIDLLHE
jgi:hypothetical protein